MVLVHDPANLSLSEQRRKVQERKFENFRSAQNIWRQIDDSDRAFILKEFGYADVDGAIERERAAGYDLSTLKATGAKRDRLINSIRFYPRTVRQREKQLARIAAHPEPRSVRVRKHERQLREKGLRRPKENLVNKETEPWRLK